jgi:uncharacterized Zn-binding protein involved in type VI secretion
MLPAARKNDFHVCPAHQGGPLASSPSGRVETNSLPQARGADQADCNGPPDFVVTGSGTVTVNSQPAARATDKTMHQGILLGGSGNVFIGGPTAGATLGNPAAGNAECEAVAASRHTPGAKRQSYGNCGLEAWRSIINRQRVAAGKPPLSEDDLLRRAQDLGAAGKNPAEPWAIGAGTADDRLKVLQDQGIDAASEADTPENLQQAVGERRGVSVSVHPYWYWPAWTGAQPHWSHHILVTGIKYDENGEIKAYVVNDTGLGICGLEISAKDFAYAKHQGAPLTTTKKPVW